MVVNNKFMNNIGRIQNSPLTPAVQKPSQHTGDFGKILQDKMSQNPGVKFSKHAEMRLQARNINLTDVQKEKIGSAVDKAEAKGVKESLVVVDNIAFVVNVKNRTVITAVNSNELKENVFTNIDGAVFG
ncbi:MAG: flagellar biosynthesis protein [Clostridia bacterium]|nr:flagellar biosynthesis protein [Clostridia bacterium]